MGLTLKKFKDVTDVGLNCLRLLKNGNMACGSLYKKISILNLDTGKNIQVLRGHTAEIWDLQIPLNNKTNELISCSEDKRIKFWNLETGECFKTLVSSNLDTIFSQYQVLNMGLDTRPVFITVKRHKTGTKTVYQLFFFNSFN
jgi:WD40 repeat protein